MSTPAKWQALVAAAEEFQARGPRQLATVGDQFAAKDAEEDAQARRRHEQRQRPTGRSSTSITT